MGGSGRQNRPQRRPAQVRSANLAHKQMAGDEPRPSRCSTWQRASVHLVAVVVLAGGVPLRQARPHRGVVSAPRAVVLGTRILVIEIAWIERPPRAVVARLVVVSVAAKGERCGRGTGRDGTG